LGARDREEDCVCKHLLLLWKEESNDRTKIIDQSRQPGPGHNLKKQFSDWKRAWEGRGGGNSKRGDGIL